MLKCEKCGADRPEKRISICTTCGSSYLLGLRWNRLADMVIAAFVLPPFFGFMAYFLFLTFTNEKPEFTKIRPTVSLILFGMTSIFVLGFLIEALTRSQRARKVAGKILRTALFISILLVGANIMFALFMAPAWALIMFFTFILLWIYTFFLKERK